VDRVAIVLTANVHAFLTQTGVTNWPSTPTSCQSSNDAPSSQRANPDEEQLMLGVRDKKRQKATENDKRAPMSEAVFDLSPAAITDANDLSTF
jgi:hypothetical protein